MVRLTSDAQNQHASTKKETNGKHSTFYQIGGPEVLRIEEGPSREPGKGEAKLRVQAIAQ